MHRLRFCLRPFRSAQTFVLGRTLYSRHLPSDMFTVMVKFLAHPAAYQKLFTLSCPGPKHEAYIQKLQFCILTQICICNILKKVVIPDNSCGMHLP